MEIDMSVLEEVKVTSYSIGGAGGDIVPIACEANSDGSVRTIPPATDAAGVTEYESGMVYSGESRGMGASPTGHYTQMVWDDSDASAPLSRQTMLKMFAADYAGGGARLGDADTFDFFAYDASFRGGVSVAVGDVDGAGVGTSAATLGDGSVRVVFRSGTDEPAWSHGGDDLLIGGTTAFDGAPGNLQIAAFTGFDLL